MGKKLSRNMRKRFNLIAFVIALPICGISSWAALRLVGLFGLDLDSRGLHFLIVVLILVYLRGISFLHKTLLNLSENEEL